jgi:hypothetical protein
MGIQELIVREADDINCTMGQSKDEPIEPDLPDNMRQPYTDA